MHIKRIRDLREDNDFTQEALANQLGITQRTYSHYESGDRAIPIETLIKLANYYDCSIDYLVERTDIPTMNKKPTSL
ncbi:MAG: helix-turn-helix transcriptional regulator [Lachnospiraceae bacterium]